MVISLWKKMIAELIGTATLVLLGCGTAVFIGTSNLKTLPIGIVGVALAFGLSIVATAYVIGSVSGCHINPAVSLGVLLTGKMSIKEFVAYVVAQIAGAFAGIGILSYIVHATKLNPVAAGLGQNGFGEYSMSGLSMGGALVVEIALTFVFVFLILGVTGDASKSGIAGLVIGGTLTLVHLLGINLTGTSVNPARSLAPAVLLGGDALSQVWVFLVAPLIGAALAALIYRVIIKTPATKK